MTHASLASAHHGRYESSKAYPIASCFVVVEGLCWIAPTELHRTAPTTAASLEIARAKALQFSHWQPFHPSFARNAVTRIANSNFVKFRTGVRRFDWAWDENQEASVNRERRSFNVHTTSVYYGMLIFDPLVS